jgi:hypothetical protein
MSHFGTIKATWGSKTVSVLQVFTTSSKYKIKNFECGSGRVNI